MTKTRDAIVADFAGPDARPPLRRRDASAATSSSSSTPAASSPRTRPASSSEMARQAEQAVAEADAVVFVVDVRAGASAHDHDIARYLRSGRQARRARRQQGRGHARVAAARRVLRARPRRAASGLGGARAGRRLARRGGARGRARPRARRRARRRRRALERAGRCRCADPPRRRRPAQRRQVDADQRLARRGAAGRVRPAGNDARRDRRSVRARRAAAST